MNKLVPRIIYYKDNGVPLISCANLTCSSCVVYAYAKKRGWLDRDGIINRKYIPKEIYNGLNSLCCTLYPMAVKEYELEEKIKLL